MMSESGLIYLLLILPALFGWLAQKRVRKTYDQYRHVENKRGLSGGQAASLLLKELGLDQVELGRTSMKLTDHYDPRGKIMRLSDDIANSESLTSLGIVAHEVGHAVQDQQGYPLHRLRTRLAQPLSLMAQVSPLLYIGGFWFGLESFMLLAIAMLALMAIFALVTLPVERDASLRAQGMLKKGDLADEAELKGIRRVLRSAAFTYLANLGRRFSSFLFLVAVVGAGRGLFS